MILASLLESVFFTKKRFLYLSSNLLHDRNNFVFLQPFPKVTRLVNYFCDISEIPILGTLSTVSLVVKVMYN